MTVAEAKGRMTYAEAMSWSEYFAKRGAPSDVRQEMQRGFALVAATLVNVNGGLKGRKAATIKDFMPTERSDGGAGIDAVAAMLSAATASQRDVSGRRVWRRKR